MLEGHTVRLERYDTRLSKCILAALRHRCDADRIARLSSRGPPLGDGASIAPEPHPPTVLDKHAAPTEGSSRADGTS